MVRILVVALGAVGTLAACAGSGKPATPPLDGWSGHGDVSGEGPGWLVDDGSAVDRSPADSGPHLPDLPREADRGDHPDAAKPPPPPPPSCSNLICEPALGESCATCVKDCPCKGNEYCGANGNCKPCVEHKASGCTATAQCCSSADVCSGSGACCRPLGGPCNGDNDCCNANAKCGGAGKCCKPVGTGCAADADCCGAHQCDKSGKCE
jgi:hypothetical protein